LYGCGFAKGAKASYRSRIQGTRGEAGLGVPTWKLEIRNPVANLKG